MGKVRPEPGGAIVMDERLSGTGQDHDGQGPTRTTSRLAGRRGRPSSTREDGNTQSVSVKKNKKKRSRKSGSKVSTPSPQATGQSRNDQEQLSRDGLDMAALQPEAVVPSEADEGGDSKATESTADCSLPVFEVVPTQIPGVADKSRTSDDDVIEDNPDLYDLP